MLVQVLGSLGVADVAATVPSGQIARRVLAVLAARANRAVHPGVLADLVWTEGGPPRHNSLQAHVSRWRKVLGAHHISYAPAGYTLHATTEELDALQFEQLGNRATKLRDSGDLTTSVELYDQALSLWRGPAFGDLAADDSVRARAVELEASRSTVRLDRLEALCEIGAYDRVVADAMHLGEAEPWNEPAHRVLSRAHYGRGDQVSALRVLAELESRLRHDLGLDLGTSSQLLREQILRQEPALDLHSASRGATAPVSSGRMDERLAAFSPVTRRVVQAGSLSGHDVDTAQVRQALGLDGRALADALAPALASGILVRADDGVRFAHARVREAVIELIPAGEVLQLHRRLGESLLSRGWSTDLLRRAADHVAAAASTDPATARRAVDLDRRLADVALSQGDHAAAARHARRALASAEHATTTDAEHDGIDHAGLWFLVGEALRRSADFEGAMSSYLAAAESSDASDRIRIDSALAFEECSLHGRRHRIGMRDPSILLLERALEVVDADEVRVELLGSLGQALTFCGFDDRAGRLAEEAAVEARRCDDPELLVRTLLRSAATHDPVAAAEQRFELAREAAELSRSVEADELELETLSIWVPELMRSDLLVEAEDVIGRVEHLADVQNNALHRCKVPMWRSAIALAAGRYDEAEILIEDFRVVGEDDGYDDTARVHGFQSILLELGRGRPDRAMAVLDTFADDTAFEPWQATTIAVAHAAGDVATVTRVLTPWSARRFTLSRPFARVQTFCGCLVAAAVADVGDDAARARLAAVLAPAVGYNQVLGSGAAMLGDAAHHVELLVPAGGELKEGRVGG